MSFNKIYSKYTNVLIDLFNNNATTNNVRVDCKNEFIVMLSEDISKHFLFLPFPASEKMNSLVILYMEVTYTAIFILCLILFIFIEIYILYLTSTSNIYYEQQYEKHKDNPFLQNEILNATPAFQTPEGEHLADIVVIFIPTLIILQIMIPTLGYLYNEEMLYYDTYISFDVNIIGNQWFWTYEYVIDLYSEDNYSSWIIFNNQIETYPINFSFDSVIDLNTYNKRLLDVDNSLILPVNTNILFSFTSRDVIHSWALPQMGIKVDCIPGRITHTIFSSFALGVFYGQCSELCGPLHGFMPICVEVITFDDFIIWALIKYKITQAEVGTYTDLILCNKVFQLFDFDTEIINKFKNI